MVLFQYQDTLKAHVWLCYNLPLNPCPVRCLRCLFRVFTAVERGEWSFDDIVFEPEVSGATSGGSRGIHLGVNWGFGVLGFRSLGDWVFRALLLRIVGFELVVRFSGFRRGALIAAVCKKMLLKGSSIWTLTNAQSVISSDLHPRSQPKSTTKLRPATMEA